MRSDVKATPKLWGREILLHNDGYCAKLLIYDGVRTSSKHYHETKHETFCVISGEFEIEWGHKDLPLAMYRERFGPGKCLVLAPNTVHRVTCLSSAGGTIMEASTQDDAEDCVRLEQSVNPFGQQ